MTASNFSNASSNSEIMTTFAAKASSAVGRSVKARPSWSFERLDQDNRLDADGDVTIVSDKRGGVFQNLPAAGKRRGGLDTGQAESKRPPKSPKLAGGRREVLELTHSTPAKLSQTRREGLFEAKAGTKTAMGTRVFPFIVEDDSDPESDEPVLITPPASVDSGSNSPVRTQTVPTHAQKETARFESRRLRQEALAQKQDAQASERDIKASNVSLKNESSQPRDKVAKTEIVSQYSESNRLTVDAKPSRLVQDQRIDEKLESPTQAPLQNTKPAANHKSNASPMSGNQSRIPSQIPSSRSCIGPSKERKEADARKRAEWEARQQQKRVDEFARYKAEQEKRQAAEREAALKRQAVQKENQDVFAMQSAALARIAAQRKAASKHQPLELSRHQEAKTVDDSSREKADKLMATSGTEVKAGQYGQPIRESKNPAAPSTATSIPTAAHNEKQAPPAQTKPSNDEESVASAPAPIAPSDNKAREERIKAMTERNAKLHRAEEECENEVLPTSLPSAQPPSSAPVSLNSRAGQKIMADLNNQARAAPVEAQHRSTSKNPNRSHQRSLGEILPQDVKLVQWYYRDKITWSEIIPLFANLAGHKLSEGTLRKRARQVNNALNNAVGVSSDLLERMAIGEQGAREELNKIVHGMWPLPEKLRGEARSALPAFLRTNEQAQPDEPDHLSTTSHTLSPSYNCATELATGLPEISSSFSKEAHPQYAVKTLTPKVMQLYLEAIQDELVEQHEEATAALRQPSPEAPADYCHFVYQVQRRHVSKEERDDDILIEDVAWCICGPDLESLKEAYNRAEQELLRLRMDFAKLGDNEWTMNVSTTAEDLDLFTLEGAIAGKAQVQVKRQKRTFHDKVLPKSKADWIPRTAYIVMQEGIDKSTGDEMFEESKETILRQPFKDAVYTDLEMANRRAIKEFVRLYFESKTIRMELRQIEIQDEERKWFQQLDENELFCQSGEDEEAGKKKTVWVEKNRIQGPRNL